MVRPQGVAGSSGGEFDDDLSDSRLARTARARSTLVPTHSARIDLARRARVLALASRSRSPTTQGDGEPAGGAGALDEVSELENAGLASRDLRSEAAAKTAQKSALADLKTRFGARPPPPPDTWGTLSDFNRVAQLYSGVDTSGGFVDDQAGVFTSVACGPRNRACQRNTATRLHQLRLRLQWVAERRSLAL